MKILKESIIYICIVFFIASEFHGNICYAQELDATVSLPVYKGGFAALKEFIAQNTRYAEGLDKKGITANVTVSFIVNEQGKNEDIKILRGINAQCDSETVRVAKLISGWQPAVQFGRAIKVRLVMPIEFYIKEEIVKEERFSVSGIVSNKAAGSPIEGVFVLVKGTSEGAVTDKNGCYSLSAPGEEFELEFSSLGYGKKSEKIGKNRTINAELLPEDLIIDFSSK